MNSEDSKEKSFEERSRLMQVLNTGSGSSGNYYSTDGTYIGDSNSGTINNNEWSLNYIANLSSGDCKALASSDRYYCTTADCKGIMQETDTIAKLPIVRVSRLTIDTIVNQNFAKHGFCEIDIIVTLVIMTAKLLPPAILIIVVQNNARLL